MEIQFDTEYVFVDEKNYLKWTKEEMKNRFEMKQK